MGDLALYLESRDNIQEALADVMTREALNLSIKTIDTGRFKELNRWPKNKIEAIRDRARAAKAETIRKLTQYVDKTIDSLERVSCDVYFAKTIKDAQKIVEEIVGEEKIIVKAKTTVGKEMKLTKSLEARGNTVYETDLGDRLVQLDQTTASHAIAPALHIPLDRMVQLIKEDTGQEVDPTPESLVKAARGKIREVILQADIGITGANFLAAEEGVVGICTNEGNGRLVSSLPEEHLIVTGINKIIPSLDDASAIMLLLGIYGLGMPTTTYNSLISGPSRTGDIQMNVVLGMHGPSKVHVVLLDNKRSDALGTPLEEALYCLNCGACADVCPAYATVGPLFGGPNPPFGAIGPIWAAMQDSIEAAIQAGLYFCTLCGNCKEFCPVKIDLPRMLRYLRNQAHCEGLAPPSLDERSERVKTTGDVFGGIE